MGCCSYSKRKSGLKTNLAWSCAKKEPQLKWFLAGHSLGGAMADKNDLITDANFPVLSISASLDGLSTPTKIEAASQQYQTREALLALIFPAQKPL